MTRRISRSALLLALSLATSATAAAPLRAQQAAERGANALGELLEGLGTTGRVLMIGAHPDDEDTQLITWLARGRHVETGYLSLTRGDGGQNLIGNELGEALGVVRTEELLAARRVDGAAQWFSRAYDFGYSKSAEETWTHWPHDSLLGDVVRVVRAARPHVIVAVFSGTPRDGHGHHQASGILAREAYDVSGDTVRFPVSAYGPAWTVAKFYRAARFARESATLAMNVGEYDALLGRSYAEIAAESRSQHRSQAFGSLQRKGVQMDYVTREASRVNEATDAKREQGLFDGVDTTLMRLATAPAACATMPASVRALDAAITGARRGWMPASPDATFDALLGVRGALDAVERCAGTSAAGDVAATLATLRTRLRSAAFAASGVAVEAESERDVVATGDSAPVGVTLHNRGRRAMTATVSLDAAVTPDRTVRLEPDSSATLTLALPITAATERTLWAHAAEPWWLARARTGDVFGVAASEADARGLAGMPRVHVALSSGNAVPAIDVGGVPIVRRWADPVRGDVSRPLAVAPAISITLDRTDEYAPSGTPLDRTVRVALRSSATRARTVRVALALPKGLVADSAARTVTLAPDGAADVAFRVRGRLPAGRHEIRATATSEGETFERGYVAIEYEHIRPQRIYRPATIAVHAVEVKVPAGLTVAYFPGVGDNSAPALQQLGVAVTVLEPARLATAELGAYRAVVVGPRFWEAHPELRAASSRLVEFARRGGTVVVQYGQNEMAQPGILPYPITLGRPAQRVSVEGAEVRITDAGSRALVAPNRIGAADFAGWVQDRTLYMPATIDPRWATPLSTNDPAEPANAGALLVAPVGQGTYVYTTLAFFRQLPAGVPGAARLFVNLLALGGGDSRAPAAEARRAR